MISLIYENELFYKMIYLYYLRKLLLCKLNRKLFINIIFIFFINNIIKFIDASGIDAKIQTALSAITETVSTLVGEDTNKLIYSKYRLGETVPVDSHSHPLILSNSEMRKYQGYGWYCSICQNEDKVFYDNMLSFHCHQCEYDLCYK